MILISRSINKGVLEPLLSILDSGGLAGSPIVVNKVAGCVSEIEELSKLASQHPHGAYSVFTHGLPNKWNYPFRTVPNIADFLVPS